jgi:nitric oxide reductase NorD protein
VPEAEDVITDVARHATIYVRELWRRHHATSADASMRQLVRLQDVSQRLDLLITAVFGSSYPIRLAQPPAPATFLTKVFKRGAGPRSQGAIPSTDGANIWLPAQMSGQDPVLVLERYRILALQQAARAWRGCTHLLAELNSELESSIYLILQAQAADATLVQLLPGTRTALQAFRADALRSRPPLAEFPAFRRPLEEFVRSLLSTDPESSPPDSPAESVKLTCVLAQEFHNSLPAGSRCGPLLLKDCWTGELHLPPASGQTLLGSADFDREPAVSAPRSARLSRRPEVRQPNPDEDDEKQGAWMVQTAQPHEQAEDPVGMQRPTDRDETAAAEEFADSLSELPEARLVATHGRPKEVFLSDDVPPSLAMRCSAASTDSELLRFQYPEWDYRAGVYQEPGTTVRLLPSQEGPQDWVNRTLDQYRSMLDLVRRRFEMLRVQPVRLRKQLEGEEVDLEAYIDSYSDFKAGLPMAQALYQTCRPIKRDMSMLLLIDISGSTDGWISANKRVIDIEREALLLVSIALQNMVSPYSMVAFSGEGPHHVTVRTVKSFDEPYNNQVASRIAALEPEHYTRAGAALRHATTLLMRQSSRQRLLLLLSDGKPNDIDDYEGRYGVEDMRQAVIEAKIQGVHPFCLTIDRQAANYLPAIFGAHQYALLPKPELLPTVLLEWMKRLVVS